MASIPFAGRDYVSRDANKSSGLAAPTWYRAAAFAGRTWWKFSGHDRFPAVTGDPNGRLPLTKRPLKIISR